MDIKKVMGMKNAKELFDSPELKETYKDIFVSAHKKSEMEAERHFEREVGFIKKAMIDSEKLGKCTPLSIYTVLIDLAYHDISIEPVTKAQAYIVPRGYNKGDRRNPVWETRMYLLISSYGELYLRVKNGIIKYVDNVVLVHEGDDFKVVNGKIEHIGYMASDTITHAYIRIVRADGTEDFKAYRMSEILRYRDSSDNPKSKHWTGGVDGQPMRGMIEAKVIKHAFNAYPRVNLGSSMITEEDFNEDQIDSIIDNETTKIAASAYDDISFEDDTDTDKHGSEIDFENEEQEEEREAEETETEVEEVEVEEEETNIDSSEDINDLESLFDNF